MKIKEEFKNLIPALSVEEFKQLEENCLAEGIRDAIITWDGYIIDGHNRYEIATKHQLKYESIEKSFNSEDDVKEWMICNQFGRRNLSNYQRSVLALELQSVFSARAKERMLSGNPVPKSEQGRTIKKVADVANVGKDTIAKVKVIQATATPEVKAKLSTGEVSINQVYQEIKKEEKREQQEVKKQEQKEIIKSVQNETLKDIDTIIEIGWYKVGNQFLYFGSNTDKEFKDKLPKAKFAFADPPYNVGVDKWDFDYKWNLDYLEDFADVVAVTPGGWNAFNFYKETNMNYIWEMFCWITNGMTHGRCGYANVIKTSIFGKVKPKISQDFWKINIDISKTEDTKHKGRKPYDFMIHLIDIFTNENDIIIDVFAGSGTTLLMSEKMNRISYNAEIDKQYCIDIIKRVGTYERI
jgi:16S rRNA G966 N2-methylase RsmD